MNCIIIDDDQMSRTALVHLIHQAGNLNLVQVYNNPAEIIDVIEKGNIHLIFLDIDMPVMNGIEFLRTATVKPQVILTTTHNEYGLDAFEYNVIDYLVKPLKLPRFLKAVAKARRNFNKKENNMESNERDYMFIKKDSMLIKIDTEEILWIEALGDYITFNLVDKKKYILHSTLKAIEKILCPNKFVRVHRSYIVQMNGIKEVEDRTIYISGNSIPIGAIYRESFMKKLNSLH